MESFTVGGKQVILNLAKNPAGFNQAIATLKADKRTKDVLVAINDAPSDGMDISWIWDVDFDSLCDETVNSISLCGLRRDELNVRVKYSSFDKECTVYKNLKDAVENNLDKDSEVLYLLVNYTVIFDAEKILRNMEDNN
jgi:UDP-N-acetylmuramyl tripeptide synthase